MAAPSDATVPMTALAQMLPWRHTWQRLVFRVGQAVPGAELAALSFVHYATFGVVPRGDWKGYMLFVADFSGDTDEYLANFSDAISVRVNRAFGSCTDFIGSFPAPQFIRRVHRREHCNKVFYAAYPNATVRDVSAALDLRAVVHRLWQTALGGDPHQFHAAYVTALAQTQPTNPGRITTTSRLGLVWDALHCARTSSVTAIFRLAEGESTVFGKLGTLNDNRESVFGGVPGTHFARFVPLPFPLVPGKGSKPATELLFSAQVDGKPGAYIKLLSAAQAPELEDIWACCEDYPGRRNPGRFRRWFRSHLVPADLLVSEVRRTQLDEVQSALELRATFLRFAATHQVAIAPVDLLYDFRLTFG